MHYYKFNIGDYKSHTEHLSEMEDLTYRRMLDWYYLHEKPFPSDYGEIARLIRMRSHIDCIAVVLHEFFDLSENGWIHHRANAEIAKAGDKSSKASQSSKARWVKEKNTNAMRTHSEGNATQDTIPITQDTIPITQNLKPNVKPKAQGFALPPGVSDEIWQAFVEHRRKLRKPMTDRAAKLILAKIAAIGQNPSAVIEQSIERGWAGVFTLDASKGHHHGKSDAIATTRRLMEAAMAEEKLDAGAAQSFGGDVRASLPDPQR